MSDLGHLKLATALGFREGTRKAGDLVLKTQKRVEEFLFEQKHSGVFLPWIQGV